MEAQRGEAATKGSSSSSCSNASGNSGTEQGCHSHLELSVSDTGLGINPDILPHVFDRFWQEEATTTRKHGRLGLGLAIVKQLVELHGGAIRVVSPGEGMGTTFVISLPLLTFLEEPKGDDLVEPETLAR